MIYDKCGNLTNYGIKNGYVKTKGTNKYHSVALYRKHNCFCCIGFKLNEHFHEEFKTIKEANDFYDSFVV